MELIREQKRGEATDGTGSDLRGRVVPRESDEDLLADYADRMDRGEAGQTTMTLDPGGG
jgi:hypothetical protein